MALALTEESILHIKSEAPNLKPDEAPNLISITVKNHIKVLVTTFCLLKEKKCRCRCYRHRVENRDSRPYMNKLLSLPLLPLPVLLARVKHTITRGDKVRRGAGCGGAARRESENWRALYTSGSVALLAGWLVGSSSSSSGSSLGTEVGGWCVQHQPIHPERQTANYKQATPFFNFFF